MSPRETGDIFFTQRVRVMLRVFILIALVSLFVIFSWQLRAYLLKNKEKSSSDSSDKPPK